MSLDVTQARTRKPQRLLWVLAGVLLAVLCGLALDRWQHSAVAGRAPVAPNTWTDHRQEMLHYAFTDPAVARDLQYKAIDSLQGIQERQREIFVPLSAFDNAYQQIAPGKVETLRLTQGGGELLRLHFRLGERVYMAHAFVPTGTACGKGDAALIIPGSGHNPSWAIVGNEPSNYHRHMLVTLRDTGLIPYTMVKPNEDVLAWHNGRGAKLNPDFLVAWHLNRGGSYSASYIVQSMALVKYLKGCHSRTVVAGVSQGGGAALLNALQSQPELALVASGYSALNEWAEWAGFNQILGVAAHGRLHDATQLRALLQASPTRFLFTWGKAESGTYGVEVAEHLSARSLGALANVEYSFHDGGHVFPREEATSFIKRRLGR